MDISKITLGTAQIGLDYGIANFRGKPSYAKAIEILKYSWEHGINTFDTSPVYGNSEEIIGAFIAPKEKKNFRNLMVVSKLPKIEDIKDVPYDLLYSKIKNRVIQSLRTLNIEKFPIYLIHHAPNAFIEDGIIVKCLNQIKEENLIDRIGISIYNPNEAKASLKLKEIDVIQVPINIFDLRLIETGLLKKLKKQNYLIFARSVYLQGLFFRDPETLPKNLDIAKECLIRLWEISKEFKIKIANIALLFVRDIPEIDSLVIGAEKMEQVEDNLKIIKEDALDHDLHQLIREEFSEIPEIIINPSFWNQ